MDAWLDFICDQVIVPCTGGIFLSPSEVHGDVEVLALSSNVFEVIFYTNRGGGDLEIRC